MRPRNGRAGVLGSHLPWRPETRVLRVDRARRVRGRTRPCAGAIGYAGPISIEWEDAGMDRLHGAKEAFSTSGHCCGSCGDVVRRRVQQPKSSGSAVATRAGRPTARSLFVVDPQVVVARSVCQAAYATPMAAAIPIRSGCTATPRLLGNRNNLLAGALLTALPALPVDLRCTIGDCSLQPSDSRTASRTDGLPRVIRRSKIASDACGRDLSPVDAFSGSPRWQCRSPIVHRRSTVKPARR